MSRLTLDDFVDLPGTTIDRLPEQCRATKAHVSRSLWRGFPQRLIELEALGWVCIHRSNRAYFGSLVLEGYSQLVWSVV